MYKVFLASKNNYHIVSELNIEINHSVYCLDSINNEDVRVVYSHPQALAQCYDYLINNFKNIQLHSYQVIGSNIMTDSKYENVRQFLEIQKICRILQNFITISLSFSEVEDF